MGQSDENTIEAVRKMRPLFYRIHYRFQVDKSHFFPLLATKQPLGISAITVNSQKDLAVEQRNGPKGLEGFEDQGHHQMCKHSRRFFTCHLRVYGTC
jgi:hypothetical protein